MQREEQAYHRFRKKLRYNLRLKGQQEPILNRRPSEIREGELASSLHSTWRQREGCGLAQTYDSRYEVGNTKWEKATEKQNLIQNYSF